MFKQLKRRAHGTLAWGLASGAAGIAALALTPAANAASTSGVRTHVHRADAALQQVIANASSGTFASALQALLAQVGAANHQAASLYHHAHGAAARSRAAQALEMVTNQQHRDVSGLTGVLGVTPGPQQGGLATAIQSLTQGENSVLSLLTHLLGNLPAPAQAPVAGTVASLSGSNAGELTQLAGAVGPGSIACQAASAFTGLVTTMVTAAQNDLTDVNSLVSLLPASMQAQVTQFISNLPSEVSKLATQFETALNCSGTGSTGPTGSTAPTGSTSVTGVPGIPAIPGFGTVFGQFQQFLTGLQKGGLPGVPTGTGLPGLPTGTGLPGLPTGTGLPGLGGLSL